MVITVYTSSRPANPRRALAASVLLLAFACVLAWMLTVKRSGAALIGPIKPPGWEISFHRPRRFRNDRIMITPFGSAYYCRSLTANGTPAMLALHRLETGATDPRSVCDRVLRAHLGRQAPPAGTLPYTWFDKKLGPFDAVEVWDPLIGGIIVRAALSTDSVAYAVSLAVRGEITPDLYQLFEMTCASIAYTPR